MAKEVSCKNSTKKVISVRILNDLCDALNKMFD